MRILNLAILTFVSMLFFSTGVQAHWDRLENLKEAAEAKAAAAAHAAEAAATSPEAEELGQGVGQAALEAQGAKSLAE